MSDLAGIRYLLTDVDDTLTTAGRLLPETLAALDRLQKNGIRTLAITGACAGWCDQMIRLWPLDAVIGENGAFVFSKGPDGQLAKQFFTDAVTLRRQQETLLSTLQARIDTIAGMQIADDQPYRLCDVAIDFAPPGETPATAESIDRLLADLKQAGIRAQRSSIHINCWSENYDKRLMTERFLQQRFGLSAEEMLQQCAFVGDAPNDEPMFGWLSQTFGVANIRAHLPDMRHRPETILIRPGGLGFADLAEQILADG